MAINVEQSVDYIKKLLTDMPTIGMVLGSGLGALADEIENPIYIDYKDIPNFVTSTAPGHHGRFVVGKLQGKQVICMQGRVHFYEGYSLEQVTLPIRCMKKLGVENLILTNASGGVNLDYKAGDFMIIKDHINFLGENPLIGANNVEFGPRFCDMTYTYNPELRDLAKDIAKNLNIDVKEGVYMACTGPSYETPAEIRMFRTWGVDAVGMSTVPEAIVANHASMNIVAISCITNMAAGVLPEMLTEEEVIVTANAKSADFRKLVLGIVEKM